MLIYNIYGVLMKKIYFAFFCLALSVLLSSCGSFNVYDDENTTHLIKEVDGTPLCFKHFNGNLISIYHYTGDKQLGYYIEITDYKMQKIDSIAISRNEDEHMVSTAIINNKLLLIGSKYENKKKDITYYARIIDLSRKQFLNYDSLYIFNTENKNLDELKNSFIRFSPDSSKFSITTISSDNMDTTFYTSKVYDWNFHKLNEFTIKKFYLDSKKDFLLENTIDNQGNSYYITAFSDDKVKENFVLIDRVALNGTVTSKQFNFDKHFPENKKESDICQIACCKIINDNNLALVIAHRIDGNKTISITYINYDFSNDKVNINQTHKFTKDLMEKLVDDNNLNRYFIYDLYFTDDGNIIVPLCFEVVEQVSLKVNSYTYYNFGKHLILCYDKDFKPLWQTTLNADLKSNLSTEVVKGLGWGEIPNGFTQLYFDKDKIYIYGVMQVDEMGFHKFCLNKSDGKILDSKTLISVSGRQSLSPDRFIPINVNQWILPYQERSAWVGPLSGSDYFIVTYPKITN